MTILAQAVLKISGSHFFYCYNGRVEKGAYIYHTIKFQSSTQIGFQDTVCT